MIFPFSYLMIILSLRYRLSTHPSFSGNGKEGCNYTSTEDMHIDYRRITASKDSKLCWGPCWDMQESCFPWQGSLREEKKDNSRRTQMRQSEERAVIGRTLAIAKDRKAIQISLSENGNVFLILQRNSKGQAALVPKCIQEFRWG